MGHWVLTVALVPVGVIEFKKTYNQAITAHINVQWHEPPVSCGTHSHVLSPWVLRLCAASTSSGTFWLWLALGCTWEARVS